MSTIFTPYGDWPPLNIGGRSGPQGPDETAAMSCVRYRRDREIGANLLSTPSCPSRCYPLCVFAKLAGVDPLTVASGHLHKARDFAFEGTRYIWSPASSFLFVPRSSRSGLRLCRRALRGVPIIAAAATAPRECGSHQGHLFARKQCLGRGFGCTVGQSLPPVRRQLPTAIDPRAEISSAGLPPAARPTSGFSPALPAAAGDRYRSSQRSSKRDPL